MSAELRALYPAAVLDHGRNPRNRRTTGACAHRAHAENPLCGDAVDVGVEIDGGDVIREVAFEGQSCLIATASASLMTELVLDRTSHEARVLWDRLRTVIDGAVAAPFGPELDPRLAVLACVRGHSERFQCVTLAWRCLFAALER